VGLYKATAGADRVLTKTIRPIGDVPGTLLEEWISGPPVSLATRDVRFLGAE